MKSEKNSECRMLKKYRKFHTTFTKLKKEYVQKEIFINKNSTFGRCFQK